MVGLAIDTNFCVTNQHDSDLDSISFDINSFGYIRHSILINVSQGKKKKSNPASIGSTK